MMSIDAGAIGAEPENACRRLTDDRGSGLVAAITSLFAFTFVGLVWLAQDVDRAVSNESAAQSIAFQAARSGAQATDVGSLRAGEVVIDPARAHQAAASTAARLFDSYGVDGAVVRCVVDAGGTKVTVEIAIHDAGRTARGVGIVTAERTE